MLAEKAPQGVGNFPLYKGNYKLIFKTPHS